MFNIQFDAKGFYEALPHRISIRNYKNKNLSDEDFNLLSQKVEAINSLNLGIKVYLMKQNEQDVFKGILGSYGKINHAPNYLALVGDITTNQVEAMIGYIGEYLVLECTARQIDTCWVGGAFKKSEVIKETNLKANEKVFSLIALGYRDSTKVDIIKMLSPSKRKPLEKIVSNYQDYLEAPSYLKECIEYARIAPSAVNRQPWQFEVGKTYLKINRREANSKNSKYEKSKDIDLGIALFHIITVLTYYEKTFKIAFGENVFAEITLV